MSLTAERFLTKNPEQLSLRERRQLAGTWVAMELYSPTNLALRRIVALGQSPSHCRQQLRAIGKDVRQFEYILLK